MQEANSLVAKEDTHITKEELGCRELRFSYNQVLSCIYQDICCLAQQKQHQDVLCTHSYYLQHIPPMYNAFLFDLIRLDMNSMDGERKIDKHTHKTARGERNYFIMSKWI